MCGIAVSFEPFGDSRLVDVVRMTRMVAHRGPDSEGYVVISDDGAHSLWGSDTDSGVIGSDLPFAPTSPVDQPVVDTGLVIMGHRRLSIVDLSPTGHQPMSFAGGQLWVVFNGEIYNHNELRATLESLGHRFKGASDTEVILAAYSEWGVESLKHLRGMFAFVLVDRTNRTLLAVRDRFGIKPLYYRRTATGGLLFGSEIKQLVDQRAQETVNGPRLYDFLNFGVQDHTDETMFGGICQVPAGSLVSFGLGTRVSGVIPRRWWTLERAAFDGSLAEASSIFRGLLADSVQEHLSGDVAVGSCLSGGLDSTSIVCLVRRGLDVSVSKAPQRTFTATSSTASIDESRWAQLVIDATGSQSFLVEPDLTGVAELLPRISWHMDEPFRSTSVLAQWAVFQAAGRSGTKVVLDGQGADEQLAGYLSFFGWRLVELARSRNLIALRADVLALHRVHPEALRGALMMAGYLMTPAGVGRRLGRLVGAPGQNPDAWLDRAKLGVFGYPDPLAQSGARSPSVQALATAQVSSANLPMLLHYEDRDSMAHGVEARVPFLDHRIVEFVAGLPSAHLISDGQTKRVLREAMVGIIPEPIRTRVDKIGFQTADESWMRANPSAVHGLVETSMERLPDVIRPRYLVRARRMLEGRAPLDPALWRVISAGAWAERFSVDLSA